MENIATLQAIVTADVSRFEQAMADVRKSGEGSMNFLSGLGDMGKALTLGLTVPLLGAGAAITKVGMDFDAEMRNINSLLLLNEEQFRALGTQVNEFASDTIYGANATADALYTIVSAGIGVKDTAEAMTLLGTATKVAASGRDDLNQTTMAIIAMYENFNKMGYSSEMIGDVISNMVQKGAGSLSTYTTNMAKIGPAAAALGIDFTELGSDIAQLSLTYGNGAKPMTAMGMMMSNLMRPNLTLQAAFKELGVVTGSALIDKFGGLNEALFALRGHMSEIDFQKAFSKTGSEAVNLLTNDIEGTREALLEFQNTVEGAAARALEQQMMSAQAAFDKAKSAIEGVAVVLSNTLLPMLTPIFNGVADIANAFIHADPAVQQAAVAFGLLAAAIGPVMWAFSFIVGSLSPIGLALKGAALAAVAFATDFGGIATAVKDTANKAIAALKPLTDALTGFYNELFPEQANTDFGAGLADGLEGILGIADKIKLPNTGEMITVDKPTALWDIYKQKGYDKAFSWDEFKKAALEGGWKGGKAYLNPGEHIMIGDWQDPIDELGSFGDKLREGWQSIVDFANDPFPIKADTFNAVLDDAGVVPTTIPFIERLQAAITAAWPGVSAALVTLWGQVTAWFDSTVGAGISWLAGLFSGTEAGGTTPIYEAVKALLSGDIYKAIDEVIPGAGTKLKDLIGGDWGAKVGEAFPEISKGLGTLSTKFREWFENDALPSFAKSIGYFAGKIGVAIGQALGMIGGGAGDAAGNALAGVQEFGDLVGQGFSEAMTDSGVGQATDKSAFQNWADGVVTSIAGALGLAAAAVGVFGLFTGGLWGGISGALSVPAWFFGKVFAFATTVVTTITGQVVTLLGLPTSWSGVGAALLKGLTAAIAAAPAVALAFTVAAGITIGSMLYMAIPESVRNEMQTTIADVINGNTGTDGGAEYGLDLFEQRSYELAETLGKIFNNPKLAEVAGDLAEAKGQMNDITKTALDAQADMDQFFADYGTLGSGNFLDLDKDGVMGAFDFVINPPKIDFSSSTAGEDYMASIQDQFDTGLLFINNLDIPMEEKYALLAQLEDIRTDASTTALMIPLMAQWQSGGVDPQTWLDEAGLEIAFDINGIAYFKPTAVEVDTTGSTFTYTNDFVLPTPDTAPVWNFGAAGEGRAPAGFAITADQIIDPAMPAQVEETMLAANTVIETNTSLWGITAAAQLNNGNLDAQAIKDQFITPLEEFWTTAFGAEGPMSTTVKAFAAGFVLAMSDMSTALTNLNISISDELTKFVETFTLKEVDITTAMTLLKDNFVGKLGLLETNVMAKMPNIAIKFDLVTTAVNSLVTALSNLGLAAASVGNITVPGSSGMDLPSHAKGLDSVPYDGYVAELHKNEMVLTAREAQTYRMGEAGTVSNKNVSRTDNSTTVINISGVQDVDGVVRELKRRGVKIG